MALVSLNLQPSQKRLRDFGVAALCMCSLTGLALLLFGRVSVRGLLVFCAIGLVMYVISRISTRLIRPIYQGLVLITFPVGWAVSHLVMGFFYYGIVSIIAVIFKAFGRDPLCRKFDPDARTYWIPYKHRRSAKDYFRQF